MSIAALELNDQSLLIQAEDGALHAEPGFARLTPDGIETGEEARAVAWREPRKYTATPALSTIWLRSTMIDEESIRMPGLLPSRMIESEMRKLFELA